MYLKEIADLKEIFFFAAMNLICKLNSICTEVHVHVVVFERKYTPYLHENLSRDDRASARILYTTEEVSKKIMSLSVGIAF